MISQIFKLFICLGLLLGKLDKCLSFHRQGGGRVWICTLQETMLFSMRCEILNSDDRPNPFLTSLVDAAMSKCCILWLGSSCRGIL